MTPWAVAHEAPLSMEFSRQEYRSGLPFPSPGDLSDPGIEPGLLHGSQILYRLSHQGSPSPHPPFKCKVIGKTCSALQRLCLFTHGRRIIFFLHTHMFTKPSFYIQAPLWRRQGEGEELLKGSKYIPKEMCAR